MNNLKKFFNNNKNKDLHKWHHYFDIYEENFLKYKKKGITLLEIGVSKGGSLKMWQNYFNKESLIVGIDILPECKKYEHENIKIFIGDQKNINFLESVIKSIGKPDIIIDDGGHSSNQQIISFNCLYYHLKNKGTYIVEDTHTSYDLRFQDRNDGFTFMDYAKSISDKMNLWFQNKDFNAYSSDVEQNIKVPYLTKNTYKICFYNSMVVFEKRIINQPRNEVR